MRFNLILDKAHADYNTIWTELSGMDTHAMLYYWHNDDYTYAPVLAQVSDWLSTRTWVDSGAIVDSSTDVWDTDFTTQINSKLATKTVVNR
jgi:hypothetical protein